MKWILGLLGIVAIVIVGGYFLLRRADIPYETLAAKYESSASHYVDLPGGVRMHYRDQGLQQLPGAPPVPTILLIHGFSASVHTWDAWIAPLGEDYRVVSIDLPGHGLTRAPAGYRASIEAFRDAVASFAQAEHLGRFAIVGNSMGGNVAWEYTLAHPDQIEALVLVDSAGWPHTEDSEVSSSPMMQALRNPMLGPMLRDLDNTALFRKGVQAAFADRALANDAMVTRYVELSRAPGHRDILLQLQTNYAARRVATNEVLAPITAPTLILWGAQDHLIPVTDAQRFKDAIHGSEVVVYDNSGHLPQEEIPDVSSTAVTEFLYRVHEAGYEATAAAAE